MPTEPLGPHGGDASAAQGQDVGDLYLRYLAGHPATAQNLARKLCVRFVSDNPSAALVNTVAAAYTRNRTAILPTLRAIVDSAEFWSSYHAKVRRPTENLLATLRILGGYMTTDTQGALSTLRWLTYNMGNTPLDWAPPNGYPDVAAAWRSSSTLLSLWQYHRGFTQNWWNGVLRVPATTNLYSTTLKTSGEVIAQLAVRLTGNPMQPALRAALQTFLNEPASTPVASSNLRWYLNHLIPLILDSAWHARG